MSPSPLSRWCRLSLVAALSTQIWLMPMAQAQLFGGDDEARQAIIKLRQEVESLRTEGQRGRLQLANQIEAQQRQISQMRGQIETLEKQIADLQRGGGSAPASGGAGLPRLPGNQDPGGLLGASTAEQAAYEQAIDVFRDGDYGAAAQAMARFVEQYPNSSLAPSARFYWGSSLYATKEYRSAIQQLENMVQTAPEHPRAPDALLVVAGSQVELGDRSSARATLQRIGREYPNTPAADTARDRLRLLP